MTMTGKIIKVTMEIETDHLEELKDTLTNCGVVEHWKVLKVEE